MRQFILSTAGLVVAYLLGATLLAQQPAGVPRAGHKDPQPAADSTSLRFALRHGHIQGNLRYFFMATDNAAGLTDYVANAVGGQLRYESAPYHRLQFAVGSQFIYNLAATDLAQADSLTGQPNRYEIGLYDIAHPGEYRDLYRLEELYLKYATPTLSLRVGKQLINTPLINLQDGRMRPTAVEGVWADWQPMKALHLEGGWLYRISPRSTKAR